jgi:hypothetical protein
MQTDRRKRANGVSGRVSLRNAVCSFYDEAERCFLGYTPFSNRKMHIEFFEQLSCIFLRQDNAKEAGNGKKLPIMAIS